MDDVSSETCLALQYEFQTHRVVSEKNPIIFTFKGIALIISVVVFAILTLINRITISSL